MMSTVSGIPAGAGQLLGKRLGKYEILALLALGGTAEIYLARIGGAAGFEKYVVVKCLHDHLADDPDFVRMFLDEARLGAHLDHSNIVQTMELGEHENRYYMVMEFLAGLSLAMVVRRSSERLPGGRVPAPLVLNLMAQSCAGLHYAHERAINGKVLNIVHRDISPQNLVVSFEGVVKVVDFGIAKAEMRETKTRAGTIKGKFAYMSPEQCVANNVDRRTDVFALGVIAHELVTGRRLFKRNSPYETYQAVIDCVVPPPSKINHELEPALDELLMKALAKDKDARYPTAEAFGDALLSYLHHRGKGSGPGDVARFFDATFAQEIDEHSARMRELISGRDVEVSKWDGEDEDPKKSETLDLGGDKVIPLDTADIAHPDDTQDPDQDPDADPDDAPAEATRIEANPLERLREMNLASKPAAASAPARAPAASAPAARSPAAPTRIPSVVPSVVPSVTGRPPASAAARPAAASPAPAEPSPLDGDLPRPRQPGPRAPTLGGGPPKAAPRTERPGGAKGPLAPSGLSRATGPAEAIGAAPVAPAPVDPPPLIPPREIAPPAVNIRGAAPRPAPAGPAPEKFPDRAEMRTQIADDLVPPAMQRTQPAVLAPGHRTQPAVLAAGHRTQPAIAAAGERTQPAFPAELGHRETVLQDAASPPPPDSQGQGQPPPARYPSPSQPPPMMMGGLHGFPLPPPAPGSYGAPLPTGYPVMNPQMSQQMQSGNVYPSDPYGARPSIPSLADAAARQVGDPGPQHGLGPLVGPQHAANLMSPVGPQYGQQVDWEQAAGARARALPTWVMIALFIGAIGIALTITIVLARMMR